jgi:predicted deacetylase
MREFAARGMAFTVGVIPYVCEGDVHSTTPQRLIPLDTAKVNLLHDAEMAGTVDAAVHGYSHQNRLHSGAGYLSEFAGLPEDLQRSRLRAAKSEVERLAGTKVQTFIPPFDNYDGATVLAAEAAGFQCLSAAAEGPSTRLTRLEALPITIPIGGLRGAIAYTRRHDIRAAIIGVLFHPIDFCESKDRRATTSLADFEHLLDWVSQLPNVRVVSISWLLHGNADLGPARLANNASVVFMPQLFTQGAMNTGVYLEREDAGRTRASALGVGAIISLFMFCVGGFLAVLVIRVHPLMRRYLIVSAILTGLMIVARIVHYGVFGAHSACCLIVVSGIVVASISSRAPRTGPLCN